MEFTSCHRTKKDKTDPTSPNYQDEIRNNATNQTPNCQPSNAPKSPVNK